MVVTVRQWADPCRRDGEGERDGDVRRHGLVSASVAASDAFAEGEDQEEDHEPRHQLSSHDVLHPVWGAFGDGCGGVLCGLGTFGGGALTTPTLDCPIGAASVERRVLPMR